MKYLFLLMLLAGCGPSSSEKKEAIETFIKACEVPVGGELRLNSWGNEVVLTCPQFKEKAHQ